jgi:hypothetical protein
MEIKIITTSDGYEALYLNNKLYCSGNPLGEGNSKLFLLQLSEQLGFTSKDIKFFDLTEEDESLMDGDFEENLLDYIENYL